MLTNEQQIGLHVAADADVEFVKPRICRLCAAMGIGSERLIFTHMKTHNAQWLGYSPTVLPRRLRRLGESITDTRQVTRERCGRRMSSGLTFRGVFDPDGSLGIRQFFESKQHPGEKLSVG